MQNLDVQGDLGIVTAAEAAKILGITRRAVLARVHAGTLSAAMKASGKTGAFLFYRDHIEALAASSKTGGAR